MADTTPMQQFERGVKTIDDALRAALKQRDVSFWHIARTVVGANTHPHDSTFMVWAIPHKEESQLFTREEISGSANGLDSFVAAKVRTLAERCAAWVRGP